MTTWVISPVFPLWYRCLLHLIGVNFVLFVLTRQEKFHFNNQLLAAPCRKNVGLINRLKGRAVMLLQTN